MFIETIAQYLNGFDVNINIRSNADGTLTMVIIPKPLKGKDLPFSPVSVTAKPEFFDTPEFLDQFKPVLNVTKEKISNIGIYTDALDKIEKKKKEDLDKKKDTSKPSSKTAKPSGQTVTKTEKKQVPNPDYIKPEDRNEENPDYDPDTYDEDEPEFIEEEVKVEESIQKPLI